MDLFAGVMTNIQDTRQKESRIVCRQAKYISCKEEIFLFYERSTSYSKTVRFIWQKLCAWQRMYIWRTWNDCSVVKSTHCSCRETIALFPLPTSRFTSILNSSSRGSNHLFWLMYIPGTHMVHMHTYRQNSHIK